MSDRETPPGQLTEPPPGWQPWQPPPPPPGPGWSSAVDGWPQTPQTPQPPQPTGWAAPPPGYWQAPPQYANSSLAITAAVLLLVMGVLLGLIGLAVLAFAAGGGELLEQIDPTLVGAGGAIAAVLMVAAVIMLLLSALHVASAIGVFVHKGWARWAGITAAVIGLIFGLLMLLGQVDAGLSFADLVVPIIWIAAYGFSAAALALGGAHFTPRYPGRP